MRGERLIRECRQMQAGLEVFQGMHHAIRLSGLPAFNGHRWTQPRKCRRLHTGGPGEIHDGTAEQRCQVQRGRVEPAHTGIVWVDTGIVVHINAGKYALRAHHFENMLHHLVLREHRPECLVLHYQYLDKAEALAGRVREIAAEMGVEAPYVVAMGGHGYPEYGQPSEREGTLAVQSTDRGSALSCLKLRVDPESRRVRGFQHEYVPVAPEGVAPDAHVLSLLDRYRELLPKEDEPILGFARVDLPRRRDADSPLGNLVTDAVRIAARADLCLLGGGCFKSGIPRGAITAAALREALPFDNKVTVMQMSGRAIRRLLEESVEPTMGHSKVLQLSGLQTIYDPGRPFGRRVVSARFSDGSSLDDHRTYRLASDDFLARGGDGYSFQSARRVEAGEKVRDVVARHLRQQGLVGPVATGRIRRVDSLRGPATPG